MPRIDDIKYKRKEAIADPPVDGGLASDVDPLEAAFRQSIRVSTADVVKYLLEHLTSPLVMMIAGSKDPSAASAWASGQRAPRRGTEQRLRAAYRVFLVIQATDNVHSARNWMMGINPQLGDESPLQALSEDRLKDVVIAAESYARN